MELTAKTFPRKHYGGAYFELVDLFAIVEGEWADAKRTLDMKDSQSIFRLAQATKALEAAKPDDYTARIYVPGGQVLTHTGTLAECKTFVVDTMATLKEGQ